jgi:hypothetical protein
MKWITQAPCPDVGRRIKKNELPLKSYSTEFKRVSDKNWHLLHE